MCSRGRVAGTGFEILHRVGRSLNVLSPISMKLPKKFNFNVTVSTFTQTQPQRAEMVREKKKGKRG